MVRCGRSWWGGCSRFCYELFLVLKGCGGDNGACRYYLISEEGLVFYRLGSFC